jgi:hypothetical protein
VLHYFFLATFLVFLVILLHFSQLLLQPDIFDHHIVVSLEIDGNHHLALIHNLNWSLGVEDVLASLDEVLLFLAKVALSDAT